MEKQSAPPPYSPEQQGFYPPQQAYNSPPQGYHPPPQGHYPPPSAPIVTPQVTSVTVNAASVPIGGSCPICHRGNFSGSFTLCGWLCCLFCFPCGIICCFCMRKKKCSNCGFSPS